MKRSHIEAVLVGVHRLAAVVEHVASRPLNYVSIFLLVESCSGALYRSADASGSPLLPQRAGISWV